jgi:hypothetical protein
MQGRWCQRAANLGDADCRVITRLIRDTHAIVFVTATSSMSMIRQMNVDVGWIYASNTTFIPGKCSTCSISAPTSASTARWLLGWKYAGRFDLWGQIR